MTNELCEKCGRARHTKAAYDVCHGPAAYVTVEHGGYGCETGCCGNRVIVYHEDGWDDYGKFEFSHDKDEMWALAREAADRLHVPFREDESHFSDD